MDIGMMGFEPDRGFGNFIILDVNLFPQLLLPIRLGILLLVVTNERMYVGAY